MLSNHSRLAVPAILGLALTLSLGDSASAGFVVNVTQMGNDVVAAGSGTLNTTDLSFSGSTFTFSYLVPSVPMAVFGGVGFGNSVPIDMYTGVSGPSSFGGPGAFGSGPASGDLVGVSYAFGDGRLFVPANYASGSFLTSTSTWSGQTFASLSLTAGTYTWTWGTGAVADSFTMNIGSSSVPEPAGLALLGTGAAGVLVYARRRKAKAPANLA